MHGIVTACARAGRFAAGHSLPSLVFLAVFVPFAFQLANDGDLYWHLRTGHWILDHSAVPTVDIFSYTMADQPWVAHEWLAAVLFDLAHEALDWAGVSVLTAAALGLVLAQIASFLRPRLDPPYVLAGLALAFSLLMPHYLARPHVLAMPVGIHWVQRLITASEEGKPPPFSLLAWMVLWANLHGGFILGLGFLFVLAIEAILDAPDGVPHAVLAKRWAIFAGMAILATLITPNGLTGFLHPFHLLGLQSLPMFVGEWKSASFAEFTPLEGLILLAILIGFRSDLRLPWVRLLLLLALFHLAFKHARNAELLGLYAPLLLATPLARNLEPRLHTHPLSRFFQRLPLSLDGWHRVSIGIFVLLVTSLAVIAEVRPAIPPTGLEIAVEVARKEGLVSRRVFNHYDFGGYLIFSQIPVFIDGRTDLYGDAFLERYARAVGMRHIDQLEAVLRDYDIGWTLLRPSDPATVLLDRLPGWQRHYTNDVAVIHVRTSSRPAGKGGKPR
ncbi:MAG TPA: hypothetical protein VNL74_00820 [Methylococcus sp.]|nr:hypothetical protein [Methylococcus sp.]